MYHLEFDHPNWRHLAVKPYEHFLDAVCAYDALGLPDGPTRIVDETGMVWAVLHMPPIEPTENVDWALRTAGFVELLAHELHRAEVSGEFDREEFWAALKETRHALDILEQRGIALIQRLHHATSDHPELFIVDDDPTMLRAVGRMAVAIGFNITTVRTLRDLQHALRACDFPHVVVSDYDLPDGTGMDVQTHMTQVAERRGIPVPVMIAHSSSAENLSKMCGARVLKGNVEALDGALRLALRRVTAIADDEPRRTSPSGPDYVLHLENGVGHTWCGRLPSGVNCTSDPTPREELCRTCARAKESHR